MPSIPLDRSSSPKRYLEPSTFWSIRQGIPRWLRVLMPVIGLGVPLLLWTILSYSGLTSPTFLPSPVAVLQAGWNLFTPEKFEDSLLIDILNSTGRVMAGFIAATLIGVPIGVAMGTFHTMEGLFIPIVGTVRYMPVAAFVPLIVLWVGFGEEAKIVIIFLGVVLYNIIMVADAVKFIPDELLNVAYTLGANRKQVLLRVILPATFPSILDTIRVNIAGAWNFLVLAELLAAQNGLGFRIVKSLRSFDTKSMLFCILIIGAIGLMTDYILKWISITTTPWAEHSKT